MITPRDWWLDPAEVDRLVDRELDPEEVVAREADAARDATVALRVARRRAFLDGLSVRLVREAEAAAAARDLEPIEARVRAALAADAGGARRGRLPRLRRPAVLGPLLAGLATAALLVVGLGLGWIGSREAEATPPQILAAELLHTPAGPSAVGTCAPEPATSPFRFPLVAGKELGVRGCPEPRADAGTRAPEPVKAVLYRIEDLAVVGFVAVPDEGASAGPEIGVTRLEDAVVFDVPIRGTRYFLAVDRETVDTRGTCAACHGPARAAAKNPHYLKERRLPGR